MKGAKQVWVIAGTLGIYYGTWRTKREAIYQHCKDLGKTWDYCKKKGDFASKAVLILHEK